MTQELFWLTLTTLMTALFWLPYVLDRILVIGLGGAMANPSADAKPLTPWAQRAAQAHRNAVENLVIFATLVLAVQIQGINDNVTAAATAVYFFARLAHFVIYAAGIPVLRTLSFAVGFAAQMVMALRLLGVA